MQPASMRQYSLPFATLLFILKPYRSQIYHMMNSIYARKISREYESHSIQSDVVLPNSTWASSSQIENGHIANDDANPCVVMADSSRSQVYNDKSSGYRDKNASEGQRDSSHRCFVSAPVCVRPG